MNLKWIGASLVIAGCGGMGFIMALLYKREVLLLRRLAGILEFMGCELEYRCTPLPELFKKAAFQLTGPLRTYFFCLSEELESQVAPDVSCCVSVALKRTPELPKRAVNLLQQLGDSLGQFDLSGQLKGFRSVEKDCLRELNNLENDRTQRTRSYQTLGLCAGAALAILFL